MIKFLTKLRLVITTIGLAAMFVLGGIFLFQQIKKQSDLSKAELVQKRAELDQYYNNALRSCYFLIKGEFLDPEGLFRHLNELHEKMKKDGYTWTEIAKMDSSALDLASRDIVDLFFVPDKEDESSAL